MALGFKITKREFKTRVGYLVLGIFASNIALELREGINGSFGTGLNFWLVNSIGVLAVLYFFDFT